MSRVGQLSFSRGEIRSELHSRVDLAAYTSGLSDLRNAYVKVFGGVRKRPGSRFIADIGGRGRLIRFQFSTTQQYLLVFTDQKMIIVRDGGVVVYPTGHASEGQVVEVATPYLEADLPTLAYTQSADVMTLVHPSYAPRSLTRTDHHVWTLTTITFAPSLATPVISSVTALRGYGDINTSGDDQTWEYKVTAINSDTGEESLPSAAGSVTEKGGLGVLQQITTSPVDTIEKVNSNTITWGAVAGADRYAVYKKRSGLFGFIGESETTSFVDDGIIAELDDTPAEARNPFASSNHPGAVGYYEQRLVAGGSDGKPETGEMSRTGDFNTFTRSDPTRADDAISFTLVGKTVNRIRHFVELGRALLILTSGSIRRIERGDNGLTPELQGGTGQDVPVGASTVRPIEINDAVLFVREDEQTAMELTVDLAIAGAIPRDVSILSSHLTEGKRITDWCYCALPYRLVWATVSDGTMLSMSYLRDQAVYGWARHDTQGEYLACGSVREGLRDMAYVIVSRKVGGIPKYYLEKLDTIDESDSQDAFYVDSGLSLDAPIAITAIVSAFVAKFTAPGHGLIVGDKFDVEDIVADIDDGQGLILPGNHPANGQRFTVQAVDGDVIEFAQEFPIDSAERFVGSTWPAHRSGGVIRKVVEGVSGLGHLEGRKVHVLANGDELSPRTVAGGAISLDRGASRVHVGLPYLMDFKTLPLPAGPDITGRRKTVTEVMVRVRRSRGLKAGPSYDRLTEMKERQFEPNANPTALQDGQRDLKIRPNWNIDGAFVIRHDYPLPLEITSATPLFAVSG